MTEVAKEISAVNIEDELKQSYLDYAMSVIVGRALPDVRDGLKPVHRRVLFAMKELNNDWNKAYKKSARIVGDVIGKYHPHGDSAVYDTIVRMAQPFSLRYLLVDGQGNFGSVDGDSAAAMRYTEIRMSKLAHSLITDLEKDTVDFAPNYDGTEFAPTVFPTRIPNLLVNGSSGIAVGMATNIPPHNLGEVVEGCLAVLDNPDLSFEELLNIIPGPDFPTAAIINGRAGIVNAYRTGRGKVYVRAKYEIEENAGKSAIIINELPYQVNKARLVEKIAELVKEKKIEGITGLRDESDKDGMRVVIELRKNEVPEVIVNNLFTQTQMQTVFGINMVALVDGQPRTLTLRQILDEFIQHRRVVVNRRTQFELRKAKERAHTLEGLSIALANIDAIIQTIKQAPTPKVAKEALLGKRWDAGPVKAMLEAALASACQLTDDSDQDGLQGNEYQLTEVQAQAILDLKLHRLTGLEQDKIRKEYEEILEEIARLIGILTTPSKLLAVVREELLEVKEEFNDSRRTEIVADAIDIQNEDLITVEDRVVTLSYQGYVKSQPLDDYQAQKRGGRGKAATSMRDEDFIDQLLIASTHDTILCFSSSGKVYWLKCYQLPLGSRTAKGKPIINILPLGKDERISAILPIRNGYEEEKYVCLATQKGTIKKVELKEFSRPRSSGIIAIDLVEGDHLIGAHTTNGTNDIMLFTDTGKAMRFHEDQIRPMGRTARGVRGIRLPETGQVMSLVVVDPLCSILTATEHGYGKTTKMEDYPAKGRGGQGVISIQTSERNGLVVGSVQVAPGDEIMLITNGGTLVRTRSDEISQVGRNTQGVRLINLTKGEKLVGVQRIVDLDEGMEEGSDDDGAE